MKIKISIFCIVNLLALLAWLTNPSLDQHKKFAEKQILETYEKPDRYIKEFVYLVSQEKIYSKTYGFFSLTKFDDLGTVKTLGVGFFGTILPYEMIIENSVLIIFTLIGVIVLSRFILDSIKQ